MEVAAEEFHYFMELPDHVQIEILWFCYSSTRLKLSEACTHLNHLMWTSPKLFKKIRLNMKCLRKTKDSEAIKDLEVVLANRRKYKKLKVYNYGCKLKVDVKEKLMEAMSILGQSVNDLTVDLNITTITNITDILREFPVVEKLTLDGIVCSRLKKDLRILNTHALLPRLKDLNVDFPSSSILKVVKHIDTLERLTFQCYEADSGEDNVFSFGLKNFEDFVIKQNRLKELKIYGMQTFPLFERSHRIEELKFKLETLHAVCFFVHHNSVINFFKRQPLIKDLHLINFFEPSSFLHDRPSYSNILHKIFSLPKLKSLTIGHGETIIPGDFEYLRDIQNKSVKEMEYWGSNSEVVENFINIFPNIEKFQFEAKVVHFINVPCEKLASVNVDLLSNFSYTPSTITVERKQFEESIISFLKRHSNIRGLKIGHKDWIGSDLGLSLEFLTRVIKILKGLRTIEVFNPLQLNESLTLLNKIHSHKLHI
jgi:hypothetical protein